MSGEPIRVEGLKQGAFGLLRSILRYGSGSISDPLLEAAEFAASIVRDLAEHETEAEHARNLRQAIINARKDDSSDPQNRAILEQLMRESLEAVDESYDSVFEDVIEVRKVSGFPSTDYGDQPE